MSRGTSVAWPPASRTASSTSSSPPEVRASRISSAPSAAKRLAMAAPSPREAPVTSAMRPASRPPTMISGRLGEERELRRLVAPALVRQAGRVVAGEAGIAELRLARVTPGLAHGPVEAVDGDEGKTVDADELRHRLHIMLGGEKLAALWRVDAVEAGMGRRRAGDAHMHLPGAGGSHHLHDLLAGGAAHDAVVHQNHASALDRGPVGIVFQLHPEMADMVARLDEGAADIVVADDAEFEGDARFGGIADRRRHAGIRHRDHDIGFHARLARKLGADALPRL